MTARLEITGTQDVAEALRKYGKRAEDLISKAVTATALQVDGDIKRAIQRGPKSGVTYYRIYDPESGYMRITAGSPDAYGPSKLVAVFKTSGPGNRSAKHTSSAPGEAPATDTGSLVSSITFRQKGPLTAEVESRLPYATWLEFGTAGGKIKPRPAWVPAIEKAQPDFARRVADAIRKAAP